MFCKKTNSLRGLQSCRAPLSSHCSNSGKRESGIFAVKKDDRLIASNARSDLLGKNNARTRNSSLAKSFWCYLLSAQKVAKTLQTRFNALIIRYFCLTKVTKNNPDDENLLRSPSEIGKRATARFCPPSGRVSLFYCAYPNVLPTPA